MFPTAKSAALSAKEVAKLDTASSVTFSPIGRWSPTQQPPNPISKNIAPEARQTNVSEQRPPSPTLMGHQKAIKDVIGSRGNGTQLLSGWKEIANYMHQGVRTVQRWELIGLPVRRVKTSSRSPVIALAEDLDVWARSLHVPLLDRIEELRATISSLEAQIRSLKRELRVRNRPVHMDMTPRSHAITQPSQNCASGSPTCSRSDNSSYPTFDDVNGRGA